MMMILTLLPLFIVAALSALAVFHKEFNDNLLQRIGLSGICFGACLSGLMFFQDPSRGQSYSILVAGLSLYGIGTCMKFLKLHKPVK